MKKYARRILPLLLAALALSAILGIFAACASAQIQLKSPENVAATDALLTWDRVENASGYIVKIDHNEYETSECSYDLSQLSGYDSYDIKVLALGDGKRFTDSDWSIYTYVAPSEDDPPEEEMVVPTPGLKFVMLEDGSGFEVSRGSANINGRVVIPDMYDGLPVKKISDNAFDVTPFAPVFPDPTTGFLCNTYTTEVRLPKYLETIGDEAFLNCLVLTHIQIPDSVISIGEEAFDCCFAMESVKLPSALKEIKTDAFRNCKQLKELIIPQGVISIGYGAFSGCESVEKLIIPESVNSIGAYAFFDLSLIESVTIPKGVTRLEEGTFSYCSALKEINFTSEPEYIGGYVFRGTQWYADHPRGFVTLFNEFLLGYNGELPQGGVLDDFPTDVPNVVDNAFTGTDVVSVTIPGDEVNFGRAVFSECEKLTSAVFLGGRKVIPARIFEDCTLLNSVILPEGVTAIESNAFSDCTSLQAIKLPSTLNSIDYNAFYESALEAVNLPAALQTIGERAFAKCPLKTVTLPAALQSIGKLAFSECYGLAEVVNLSSLPVTDVPGRYGNVAKYAVQVLTSESDKGEFFSVGDYTFYSNDGVTYLTNYSGQETHVVLPELEDKTYIIKYSAFHSIKIKSAAIPDCVTQINTDAFSYSLKQVILGKGIKKLEEDCIYGNAVYYVGDRESWLKVEGFVGNLYCYSETKPVYADEDDRRWNYWHYGENGEIVVWEKE